MAATANFALTDLKPIRPIQGWEEFWRDGQGFLRTATAAHRGRKSVFTPEILYNIIAMAIEKFVMAALMSYGALPYNHTMKDLVNAMEETFPGAVNDIRERLIELDHYQEICALDAFAVIAPAREEIPAMLELGSRMQELVMERIRSCSKKNEHPS
jgi:hypothetical protein